MKRLLLAMLLVAGLAVPATALRPQPASADLCDFFEIFGACTPFSEAAPVCSISQVLVNGTDASHTYQYERFCSDGSNAKVQANYAVATGRAVEKLSNFSGPAWTIQSSWTCSADPWIYYGAAPTCTSFKKVVIQGDPGTFDHGAGGLIPLAFPISAGNMPRAMRHVLDAQLQNAIRASNQPPPVDFEDAFGDEAAQDAECFICDALKPPPTKDPIADLTVVSIAGPTTRQAGLSGTYTVTLQNQGTKDAPLDLGIVFAGTLDQTGQIVAGAGLACEVNRGDAGINAAVICNGGTLAAGATATVVVQGRGQVSGSGVLLVNVNPSRSIAESDFANNSKQLNMTVN